MVTPPAPKDPGGSFLPGDTNNRKAVYALGGAAVVLAGLGIFGILSEQKETEKVRNAGLFFKDELEKAEARHSADFEVFAAAPERRFIEFEKAHPEIPAETFEAIWRAMQGTA